MRGFASQKLAAFAIMAMVLSACAPNLLESNRRGYEAVARSRLASFSADIAAKNPYNAMANVSYFQDGDPQISDYLSVLKDAPDAQEIFVAQANEKISSAWSIESITLIRYAVNSAKRFNLITNDINSKIESSYQNKAMALLSSGVSIENLSEANFLVFPEAERPRVAQLSFENALQQDDSAKAQGGLSGIMEYYMNHRTPENTQRVNDWIAKAKLSRSDLNSLRGIFPDAVSRRLQSLSVAVLLKIDPPDRLLLEDLKGALRGQAHITLIDAEEKDAVIVQVRKLQTEERTNSPATQTVVLGPGDIDFFSYALLMPRNASYAFELVEGSASIEYAYEIQHLGGGKVIEDKLLRDKVSDSYKSCSNARVINVFGGVQAAGFYANERMKNLCSGGRAVAASDLRPQVIRRVATTIESLTAIKKVRDAANGN